MLTRMSATVVVPQPERGAMLALSKKHGHRKAAAMLEIDFDTLVRAIAECGVHRGTVAQIRAKLGAMAVAQ